VGGAAKGRSGLTTPRGVGGRAQKVAVLDLKRSNQISIALAKFKCPHSAVRDAILRLDETIIKAEDIGRLRQCAPSGEERELLQPYLPGGEQHANFESTLGSAELFLAYMAQVPRLTPRLDAFHTKHTLPNRLADATAQINALDAATACVRASTRLPPLLSLVLALGNILNDGSTKGGAKGFRLDVLNRLGETKTAGVTPQSSLLHHLANIAVSQAADVAKALKHELVALDEASAISIVTLDADVGAMRREVESLSKEMPLVEKMAGGIDRFHEVMGQFSSEISGALDGLETRARAMRERLLALCAFFGDTSCADESEVVLQRVHAFSISFGKACRDNERQAFLKRKAEQDAKERLERQKRAESAGAAGGTPRRAGATPRKVVPAPMMDNIQGSLRRGDFRMMKALQAQMSEELASRLVHRRSQMTGGDA